MKYCDQRIEMHSRLGLRLAQPQDLECGSLTPLSLRPNVLVLDEIQKRRQAGAVQNVRLCRLMCGKAVPFRSRSPLTYGATPPRLRRSLSG